MPTSITTAPGLIHDPLTNSDLPIAETRISALLTYKRKEKKKNSDASKDRVCNAHDFFQVFSLTVALCDGSIFIPQH